MKGLELVTSPIKVDTTLTVLEKVKGTSKIYIQKTNDSFKNLTSVEEIPVKTNDKEKILKIKEMTAPQNLSTVYAGFFDLAYNCFNYFFTNDSWIPNFKLLEILSYDKLEDFTEDSIISLYVDFNANKVPYKFKMTPEKKFNVILKYLKNFISSTKNIRNNIRKDSESKYMSWVEEASINKGNLSFENQADMLKKFYFETHKEAVRELMCYLREMFIELNIDFNLEVYMNFNTCTALLETNPNMETPVILKVAPSVDSLTLNVRNGAIKINKI